MEGFSIREYASRMRNVNVFKSWPFDESAGEETVKSLLPPITIKKFTWWLDEIEYMSLDSDKKMKKVVENVDESDVDAEESVELLELKSLRGKMKATKRKSIVEIFAVAPQCQEEDGSFESIYASHEDVNWGLKGKRNEKKKKKKKNKDIISRKAKKVIKKIKKKENCFTFKQQGQDGANGDPSSSFSKEPENKISDTHVSVLKRNPRQQHLDSYKKTKYCKALKSIIEGNQNPGHPVCSILKNQTEDSFLQKSTSSILKSPFEVNHYGTQKGMKHVTFSDKDDGILSLSRNPSHSAELIITETGGSEEHLTRCIANSSTLTKENDEYLALNQDLSKSDFRDSSHNPLHSCPPPCFQDCLKTYNEASNMEKRRNKLPQAYLQNAAVDNSISLKFQRFHCLYPVELVHSFCSLSDGNICGRGISSMSEDFVGLPLNSRGELTTLNSSAKMDFSQMMNSSLDCRKSSMDQLNLFPIKSHVKENPIIVESQSDRKTDLDFDFLRINDHCFHHLESTTNKQVQKIAENDKIQSTMRLMGQEFIVSGRGFQEFEDDQIWKDKHVTDELRLGNNSNSPHFDCQTNLTDQNVFVARKLDPIPILHPRLSAGTFSNSESLFSESCPNVNPSATQLKNRQNLLHPPISAITFPFLHPDLEGHPNSYWNRRSSMAPLWYDVSEGGTQMCNSRTYYHHGTDSFVSSTQHTVMSCYPGILPVSSVLKRQHNQTKFKEQVKYIRVIDNGKRSNRQISTLPNVPRKPLNTAVLGIPESPRHIIRTTTGYTNFDSGDVPTTAE